MLEVREILLDQTFMEVQYVEIGLKLNFIPGEEYDSWWQDKKAHRFGLGPSPAV